MNSDIGNTVLVIFKPRYKGRRASSIHFGASSEVTVDKRLYYKLAVDSSYIKYSNLAQYIVNDQVCELHLNIYSYIFRNPSERKYFKDHIN